MLGTILKYFHSLRTINGQLTYTINININLIDGEIVYEPFNWF